MTKEEHMLVRNLQLMTDARLLMEQCVPIVKDVIKRLDLEILELQKKVFSTLEPE